jgi:steroid delta-isomerase-like uncharacterized protein
MPREENLEALRQAHTRYKVRDLEGHLRLYSQSVIHHGFSSRIRPGVAGLRDHHTQVLNAFPDVRLDVSDTIADGERVAYRFLFSGTHKGKYLGTPPTGEVATAAGMHMYLFKNGAVVEVWQVFDTFGFLSQIGVIPRIRDMEVAKT